MDGIETSRAEHRQLDAMMHEFDCLVAAAAPPEPLGFLHFRRDFARLLTQHLKREDWLIYPRLRASPKAELREAAERLCAEIGAFERMFAAYGRRWTSAQIAADWDGFRIETADLLQRLRRRIAMEEAELYPLLEPAFRH